MAISFVAKSAFASGVGNLTVGAVSGVQSGDLILLFVESANQAITTPSGYTIVTGAQVSAGTAGAAGGMRLNVFYRWATGADSTVSVTDTGDHTTAIKLAYRGVAATTPFDATPTTGTKTTASTSSSYPAITTATANALVIHSSALDLDSASTATTSAQANANLTSLTERHDQTVASGTGGGIVITDGFKATAGSSGTMSATVTNTQQVYITLALRPQGAVTHDATGALIGQGSTITGSATRLVPGGNVLQSGINVDDSGASATTIAHTLTGVTAGSALVAFVGWDTNQSGPAITCSVSDGTAYTAAADGLCDDVGNTQGSQVFYLENAGSGSHTITATFSELTSYRRLLVLEVAGLGTSSIEDGAANQMQASVGTTTDSISSSATGTTTNAKDCVLGFTQDVSNVDPGGTKTAGTGFTLVAGGSRILTAEIKNVSSTGAQTATFTDTGNSNRTTHVLVLKTLASGPTTHAATGALVGSGSTVSGSAQHLALHTSTGALVGQGSTITGAANRFRAHDSSGSLVGQGSTIAGSASRSTGAVTHDATGALVGQGSTVAGIAARWRAFGSSGTLVGQGAILAGTANRTRVHSATGAIVGAGAVVTGAAARTRVHTSTGAIVGSGSTIAGTAQHNIPHTSTGALVGSGSTITGSASRNTTAVSHDATGTLVGQGSQLAGTAARTRQHDASGALSGQGAILAGAANRFRSHDSSGTLVGQGAVVSGVAARTRVHTATGALVGIGSTITGSAYRATPGVPVWPLPSQVLAGVIYGPTGVEYTGTLVAGNSGIQYDIVTGQLVMPLANPILMTL